MKPNIPKGMLRVGDIADPDVGAEFFRKNKVELNIAKVTNRTARDIWNTLVVAPLNVGVALPIRGVTSVVRTAANYLLGTPWQMAHWGSKQLENLGQQVDRIRWKDSSGGDIEKQLGMKS